MKSIARRTALMLLAGLVQVQTAHSQAGPKPEFSGAPAAPAAAPQSATTPSSQDLTSAAAQSDALLAQGDIQGAREALDPMMKVHSNVYWLALRYAYLSYLLKDFKAADTYYRKAAALGPTEEAPVEGSFYAALGSNDPKWKAYARSLVKINSTHREANLRLAYDALTNRRYQEASEYYSSVLAAAPKDADALLGLGWAELYLGNSWKARKNFQQVLAMVPNNASAKQGLAGLPKTIYVGAGYSYAALDYRHIGYKTGGYSISIPVSLAYKDLWSLTGSYVRTNITFVSPTACAEQKEFNLLGSYSLTRKLSVIGAYDHISVNDPATDNGKIYSGGLNYGDVFADGNPLFYSAGGYYSYSKYPGFRVTQTLPHIGVGWSGWAYTELSWMSTNNNARGEKLDAQFGSLSLGPFYNFTVTLKGYTGKKRTPVEEWGTLIANNQDLYRGGWKTVLAWNYKDLSAFLAYGNDYVRAPLVAAITVDYTATTFVGGVNLRFGY